MIRRDHSSVHVHNVTIIVGILLLLLPTPRSPVFAQEVPNAHAHASQTDDGLLGEIAKDVRIAVVDAPPRENRENVTSELDKTFGAFTTSTDGERIYFEDLSKHVVYEITGIPLPHRPFSDLTWSNGRLIFDRWSQPHYGIHYEVDVTTMKLVVAMPFGDE